jgi:hypothetical protein
VTLCRKAGPPGWKADITDQITVTLGILTAD